MPRLTSILAGAAIGLAALFAADRILWLVTAIVVIGVAVVPLVYVIDAAFYRESRTGLIQLDGMKSALGMLKEFDDELKGVKDEDLPKTFVDRFAKKAAGG